MGCMRPFRPGRQLPPADKQKYAPLVRGAQERGIVSWKEVDVLSPVAVPTIIKTIADTRCRLNRKVIGGKTNANAQLVIKGFQEPDL